MSIGSLIPPYITMKHHIGLFTAAAGFAIGITLASAYLLLGGRYFLSIPRWAFIAFRPGFFMGYTAYDLGLSENISKAVGVFGVGLAYAALAVLVRFAWFALKLRR